MPNDTKLRPDTPDTRLPLSQRQRKALNRKLAAELRTYGLTPNGKVWEDGKALVAQGLTPKQAARLTRSVMPDDAQREAIARARDTGAASVAKADVAQVPTPEPDTDAAFRAAVTAEVEREAADLDFEPERTVVLSSRAIDVREGRVARDAKGRLLPA